MTRTFYLYLDESGNFIDTGVRAQSPSLVGGILYESGRVTEGTFKVLFSQDIHACEEYNPIYLDYLEAFQSAGVRFVIFENTERIRVVDNNVTYLNIITEGLVKLMRDLKTEYPDDSIDFKILVAWRESMNDDDTKRGYLTPEQEYLERLEEKTYIAVGRNAISGLNYHFELGSARKEMHLKAADIVCNTYLTRNGRSKFTNEQRARITAVYDSMMKYSVFESATLRYMKTLLASGRLTELAYQLCALTEFGKQSLTKLRDMLIGGLAKLNPDELTGFFKNMSLQICEFNNSHTYMEGIAFAKNYRERILDKLDILNKPKLISYWCFDTDFFILTMYDHLGNAGKCEEYLNRCKENVAVTVTSWEYINYYFLFRVRELNCLMGRFDFEAVLSKSAQLLKVLDSAKELFEVIYEDDGINDEVRSETRGKVLSIEAEAYANLIGTAPDLYEEAVACSDMAIREFGMNAGRQYEYRSMLMLEAGKTEEALDCLMKAYELDASDEDVFTRFIALVYKNPSKPAAFSLWHYLDVMVQLKKEKNPLAEKMYAALNQCAAFNEDIGLTQKVHPWQLIHKDMSMYRRLTGSTAAANEQMKLALGIAAADKSNAAMYSFALSISAEALLCERKHGANTAAAEKNFKAYYTAFMKETLPSSMAAHFAVGDIGKVSDNELMRISRGYLK